MAQVGGIGAFFGMEWAPLYGFGGLVVAALILAIWALRRLRRVGAKTGTGWAAAAIYISVFMVVVVPIGTCAMTALDRSIRRAPVESGMASIGKKLAKYVEQHGDLTPGGPVLAVADDQKPTEVVIESLKLKHLFVRKIGAYPIEHYRMEVNSKNTAVIEFRYRLDDEDPSATMTVTDARDGVFEIEFHD